MKKNLSSRPAIHDHDDEVESPFKSSGGFKRIVYALHNSWSGLRLAIQVESAFRQELILCLVLIPLALWLPLSGLERAVLLATTFLVLIVELLNSSLEAAIDRISLERHRLSKRAKDLGSAAVLIALFLCLLTWALIAGPTILALLR